MRRAVTVAIAAGLVACLPPATIDGPLEPALNPAPTAVTVSSECRALITERGARGPQTHELRWDREGVSSRRTGRGLVVGTAEQLFALRVERVGFDPGELYGEAGSGLRCEQDVISARRLPDGLEQPVVEATPACTGELEGREVALESGLTLLSAIGPLLGWRSRAEGYDPGPIGQLNYRTLDLRSSEAVRVEQWLLEPTRTMLRADPEHGACTMRDAPRSLAEARGFAIVWDPRDGARVRIGYRCCSWERNHGICELEDPLPRAEFELGGMLPDEDRLLHSGFGCGSVGLDGRLRDRDGVVVGEHGVGVEDLLGVVFLPAEHEFELAWLEGR